LAIALRFFIGFYPLLPAHYSGKQFGNLLPYLPVDPVGAAGGAVFIELQSPGVILPVLGRGVISLFTLTARKMNNVSSLRFLSHLFDDFGNRAGAYRSASFTNSEA